MSTDHEPADVLLVDDDADLCHAVATTLRTEGFKVATAGNGLEAMLYLHANADSGALPKVILLDLVMPYNAWQFREEQRKYPELYRIPVVVISGVYQPEPAAKSLEAAAYLAKPIDHELLRVIVKRYCD